MSESITMNALPSTIAGVPLTSVLPALRRLDPTARACWVYDRDALDRRARRFVTAFSELRPLVAYALKANALPPLLETIRDAGLAAEAGSLGELTMAAAAGFDANRRVLNGNGRTEEEAAWIARNGVHSVNVDHVAELDLLERHAAAAGRPIRAALRVNPDIDTPGHRYVATGHGTAKFGVAPEEALDALAARSRWPHVRLEGLHVHVGSQVLEPAPLDAAARAAIELAHASAARGAPLAFFNLGGGFGVDYTGGGSEFPLEAHARRLNELVRGEPLEWVLEPGRWLVASIGVLLAEVLWVKQRDGQRFVVLAAGLNDLLRPALYGARHRIVPIAPRPGHLERASVVGPVCESSDAFDEAAPLPPLERGDVVAVLDAGAYGAVMSSTYNGRGRLAELVASGGRLVRARAAEQPQDLLARASEDRLEI